MSRGRLLACVAILLTSLAGATMTATPPARAAALQCTATNLAYAPSAPSPGDPCWTDVTPYPFGSDGNSVTPTEPLCAGPNNSYGTSYGLTWTGEFDPQGNGVTGNPPCYLQVNSFAFRAWNRGLATTGTPSNTFGATSPIAYGVWLFNGTNWFPDPTFPGSAVCPGGTILWAGKLDYWLIGSSAAPQRTVCRFDGVNLQWEPLSLPAPAVARLPVNPITFSPVGGITSGACYAWNNCWFFGDDGIEVYWNGQALSDASAGLGASPWLQGDFTGAVAGTDSSGNAFGLAVAKSSSLTPAGLAGSGTAVPSAPDGSPPAQLFDSQGSAWAPVPFASPPQAVPQPHDPFTTDVTTVSADSQGDVWVAGAPASRLSLTGDTAQEPAPLERLTDTGGQASCPGYGPTTFTSLPETAGTRPAVNGFLWYGLSTFPDGSALAGASYSHPSTLWTESLLGGLNLPDEEPALVHAACGQPPAMTEFRRPDPLYANPKTAPSIPADLQGWTTAVAANAPNDAWAATSDGQWQFNVSNGTSVTSVGGDLAPHLYRWTDGQPPDAPAGDDNETRPSLFTLSPPVFLVAPPTIIVTPGGKHTTKRHHKPRRVKLPPPVYDVVSHVFPSANGTFILDLTFKVRPPVTVGLEALRGKVVVASSGLRRFRGHRGQLVLRLYRNHWPTRLAFVTPKTKGKR